jgi:hypothetical protein
MLCEGVSVRSISRVADVSINTVGKTLVAGTVCAAFHDEKVRNVESRRVVDEVWSFAAARHKNATDMKGPVDGAGDTWTWTALDADRQAHGLRGFLALIGSAGRPPKKRGPLPQTAPVADTINIFLTAARQARAGFRRPRISLQACVFNH